MSKPEVARPLVIVNATIVDPSQGLIMFGDLKIEDGKIKSIGERLPHLGDRVIDAKGAILAPGLVDVHVHLRQPGFEYKETINTGTAAAAAGGFSTVCCMPNTNPPLDTPQSLVALQEIIERDAHCRVFPVATISKGRRGEEAVDYNALAAAGAVAFSDDGDTCRSVDVMRQCLTASKSLGIPVMVHCEDKALAHGYMNEGSVSREMGIAGIPAAAEEVIIARDIELCQETGGWLHLQHVSTGIGADLVRQGKSNGANLTAEVMPHHLLFTDEWVGGRRRFQNGVDLIASDIPAPDFNAKVNPPLRTSGDAEALLLATQKGLFDVIATDHAPHARSDKEEKSFEEAAMGMIGSEFALPLILALVRAGHLTLSQAIDLLSCKPAKIFNLPGGTLVPNSSADLVLFDPDARWTVEDSTIVSKSKNTPLKGVELTGRVLLTLVEGKVVHDAR